MTTTHRIDLQANKRGHGKTSMSYSGKAIGASNSPIYAAARWLLNNGMAFPEDRVETYRNGTLSMSGNIGELAKWTVRENDNGQPSLKLADYVPFPARVVASRTGETDFQVSGSISPLMAVLDASHDASAPGCL